ncbi:enoyl-CoA hydratase/isomerase family protein [Gordonia sp. zg691]|uniref:enoyl-CoA hydratase/isomerase family protein n=1 Tax=Gordonia jinghuaiqii TaxID=2758710 RepID=UPI0016628713|nr:enoyl-CoA hydratase-related protein [Gordonia jinghuaiqii]MBD0863561.1 enoyl-CoA hydratase/isomerase family protein [Gordonia jinghuaiqii]
MTASIHDTADLAELAARRGGVAVETGTDVVAASIVDRVGLVILDRPDRRNALHPGMYEAVPRLLEAFADDPEIGAVMITGTGTTFCAGGDVRRKVENAGGTVAERAAGLTHNARISTLLHDMPKVTIAALPGAAVGAGLSIALATDLRIAASSAKLVAGWGDLGFSGDFGGTWFLTRLLGPSRAVEFLTSGAPMLMPQALEWGLVNRVVSAGEFAEAALDWASTIAGGPRQAWAATKGNVLRATSMSLSEALPLESEQMVLSGMTDEHKAAVRAWFEKAQLEKAQARNREGR